MYYDGNFLTTLHFPASCPRGTAPEIQIAPGFAASTWSGNPGCYVVRVFYAKCHFGWIQ